MTSRRAKKTIEGLLKQKAISDNDSVAFMIVGTLREKVTDYCGEPLPCNETVLVPQQDIWIFSVAEGIKCGAVCGQCKIEPVLEDFYRVIADPDSLSDYRTVAVKVYKQTSQGNAQGFQIRWDFVVDLDVYHND